MKRLRMAGLVTIVFLSMALSGSCADAGFGSEEEFGQWMMFYYRDPTPGKILPALEYFTGSSMYKTNATLPAVAFFSALFRKDSGTMRKTFEDISQGGSENSRVMLINILALTNTKESRELLDKARGVWASEKLQTIISNKTSGIHEDIYNMPVDNPLILDMLWASFSATGDDLPVRRIISVLHLLNDGTGEDIMVGGAANWSLKSNAQQHPRVMEICKQELLSAQGETKALLEEIVK
jgi:hypothetical protein